MSDHVVATTDEISEGSPIIVEVKGREVGIYQLGDAYYAYTNWCPHQGGPACAGTISGTSDASFDRETLEYELRWVKEGEIMMCPWHGWEFDLLSGDCLSDDRVSLLSYPVRREGEDLVVTIR